MAKYILVASINAFGCALGICSKFARKLSECLIKPSKCIWAYISLPYLIGQMYFSSPEKRICLGLSRMLLQLQLVSRQQSTFDFLALVSFSWIDMN